MAVKEINSKEYWDYRFETDWKERGGEQQSSFFSDIAIEAMPEWMKKVLSDNHLSFCDWGCALGDGTSVLKSSLGIANIVGVDISSSGIDIARSKYPGIEFIAGDFLEMLPSRQFDVLFTSNTLEHFSQPWSVLEKLSPIVTRHIIIMVPFQEYDWLEEHFYTFDYNSIPSALPSGFVLSHCRVVDTANRQPTYWHGKQVQLIYSKPSALSDAGIQLKDLEIGAAVQHEGDAVENQQVNEISTMLQQVNYYAIISEKYKKEVEAQMREIAILQDGLAQKDSIIQEKVHIEQQQQENLQQLEKQLQQLQNELVDKYQQLQYYTSSLHEVTKQIEDLEKHAALKQENLDALTLKNSVFELENTQQLNELQTLKQNHHVLSAAYYDLLNSKSWRYTLPLRLPFYYTRVAIRNIKQKGVTTFLKGIIKPTEQRSSESEGAEKVVAIDKNIPAIKDAPTPPQITGNTNAETPNKGAVCLLVQEFNEGGVERVVLDLAIYLKERGYKTAIFVANKGGRIEQEARSLDLDVFLLNQNKNTFQEAIAAFKPEMVLTNHCYFHLEVFDMPVVEVIHNAYFWQRGNSHYEKLRKKDIKYFVAVSSFVRDYSVQYLKIEDARIEVINNGLNIEGFIRPTASLRKKIRSRSDHFNIIQVASMRPSKCHHIAITAFSALVKDFPNARLQFAGGVDDAAFYQSVQQRIRKENLDDKVTFLGSLNRRELSRRLAEAHVAILPSSYEGFSIAGLEYMFFGLPMVLTKVGAAEDVIHANDIGLIIPSPIEISELNNDVIKRLGFEVKPTAITEKLTAALKQIIEFYPEWSVKGEAGIEKIEGFTIEHTVQQYERLINRTIAK